MKPTSSCFDMNAIINNDNRKRGPMITDSHPGFNFDAPLPWPRTVRGRRAGRLLWNYHSVKNGMSFRCESEGELHALYHAEVSVEVEKYRVRPFTLDEIGGRDCWYRPFLEETLSDGRLIIMDVAETYDETRSPEFDEQFDVATEYCDLHGIELRIRIRSDYDECPIFDAIKTIQSFRFTSVSAADVRLVRSTFASRDAVPLAEVRDAFKTPALGFAKLSAMMCRRIIALDLKWELNPTTPVRLVAPG